MRLSVRLHVSVTHQNSVETGEQIKLVFGKGAFLPLCFKEIRVPQR